VKVVIYTGALYWGLCIGALTGNFLSLQNFTAAKQRMQESWMMMNANHRIWRLN